MLEHCMGFIFADDCRRVYYLCTSIGDGILNTCGFLGGSLWSTQIRWVIGIFLGIALKRFTTSLMDVVGMMNNVPLVVTLGGVYSPPLVVVNGGL